MKAVAPHAPRLKATLHGWLVLDKPLGLTSTQALGRVRRLLGGRKAGHAGTLDPLATGILPLAFGEATKLVPFIMDGRKAYDFTIRWGERRATDDAEGAVTATSAVRPSPDQIRAVLPLFTGLIEQVPPAFSAIKIDGARAYDLARAGSETALKPRPVEIYALDFVESPDADTSFFRVACGKGMYVRSLARDMAEALGTCGHVAALRRTSVGPFTLDRAISLDKLEELEHKGAALTALMGLDAALDDIPALHLTPSEAQRLSVGQGLLIRPQHQNLMGASMIVARHQGTPVAIVEAREGMFRVVRGFHYGT